MTGSNSGKGVRSHKAGGRTFHSRRNKMAMERESNRRAVENKRANPKMESDITEVFRR
jgi:hypothetical protein